MRGDEEHGPPLTTPEQRAAAERLIRFYNGESYQRIYQSVNSAGRDFTADRELITKAWIAEHAGELGLL